MEKPEIIFQDREILVLNKPAGIAVTKVESIKSATLQDWLSKFFNLGKNLGVGDRAGIVHRLDKDTSGVILVAKTESSFKFLQTQFAKRLVTKKYLALVHGTPTSASFEINLPVARKKWGKFGVRIFGKQATTNFTVLKKFEFGEKFNLILTDFPKKKLKYLKNQAKFYSLLEAAPATGRTHQIRVHAKAAGFPIVRDPLYTPARLFKFDKKICPRLFLHAAKITFVHPKTKKLVFFEAELSKDLRKALQYLKELNS